MNWRTEARLYDAALILVMIALAVAGVMYVRAMTAQMDDCEQRGGVLVPSFPLSVLTPECVRPLHTPKPPGEAK